MGRGEDLGQLDADGDQPVDLEETPVVEGVVLLPPAREAVVLAVEHGPHRRGVVVTRAGVALRAERDRVDVLVVAQDEHAGRLELGPRGVGLDVSGRGVARVRGVTAHRVLDLVDDELTGLQDGLEGVAEHRQAEPTAPGLPVDVEPIRGDRVAPVAQHEPQRQVRRLGGDEGHVVRHDVDDDPQPVLPGRRGERLEAAAAAEPAGDLCVVDDVVAVARTGDGLEDRGEVDIGDAQGHEVGEDRPGVVEGEVGCQLESVGGHGDAPAHVGQVGMGIWHARPLTRPGG